MACSSRLSRSGEIFASMGSHEQYQCILDKPLATCNASPSHILGQDQATTRSNRNPLNLVRVATEPENWNKIISSSTHAVRNRPRWPFRCRLGAEGGPSRKAAQRRLFAGAVLSYKAVTHSWRNSSGSSTVCWCDRQIPPSRGRIIELRPRPSKDRHAAAVPVLWSGAERQRNAVCSPVRVLSYKAVTHS